LLTRTRSLRYECYYDVFLPFPSDPVSFFKLGGEAGGKRRGAVSFNYACAWGGDAGGLELLRGLEGLGRVGRAKDARTDALYLGADCGEINALLLQDRRLFNLILGEGSESICK
jgi:hypothetical protein